MIGMYAPLETKDTYEWGKKWHQKSKAQSQRQTLQRSTDVFELKDSQKVIIKQ
ncbi:MAG: hypothetical protein GY804_02330 [Alphaproteobacteria bacterium]|nr:hypothetical protein [Alphaproteobacteria bacterium]